MSPRSITYRDLRNTPGRVFERLAAGEPLALIAEGTEKALLVPIIDGDVETTLDAWRRGRGLLALARLQEQARRSGSATTTQRQVESQIRQARKARRDRESGR